jgi:hypothetical protein
MKQLRFVPIAALIMFGSILMSQEQPKPLGDVVRQNKPTKKATRVITDEDMPSHPQPAAATSTVPAKPAEESKDAATSKDAKETADAKEAKESPEVAQMKSRMKELDMDIPNLQRMLKGTEEAISTAPDEERRAIFENAYKNHRYSLQHAIAEKEELTKQIEEAKKAEEAKAKSDQ